MTLSRNEVSIGQRFTSVVVDNLSRTQIVQYAGASGDFNPLHTDEIYVTQVANSPSVFAHGMLTMGMSGRALTDLVGPDRVLFFGGRFLAQVWPGDTLTTELVVVEVADDESGSPVVHLDLETHNQDGKAVFSGSARARLDA